MIRSVAVSRSLNRRFNRNRRAGVNAVPRPVDKPEAAAKKEFLAPRAPSAASGATFASRSIAEPRGEAGRGERRGLHATGPGG